MAPRSGFVAIAMLLLSCQAAPAPVVSRTAYACDGDPANELRATVYETDPPTARIEHGNRTAAASLVRTASGAKFEAPGVTFWSKGKEALVTWHGMDLRCTAK